MVKSNIAISLLYPKFTVLSECEKLKNVVPSIQFFQVAKHSIC